jgi:DNA ligase (NAD+)
MSFSRIKDLVNLLNDYSRLYYVEDTPIVSDAVYDSLYNELKALEYAHPECVLPYSPTQRVGDKVSSNLESVAHVVPMLSLDNAFNDVEFAKAFTTMNQDVKYGEGVTGELKFDGLAVSLLYIDGVLSQALTRGDKLFGELITHTVKTIKSVPLRLAGNKVPSLLEVRGEILLPYDAFDSCNEQRIKNGNEPFKNVRNAAAGIVRRLDPKEAASSPLKFFAYSMARCEGFASYDTHECQLHVLNDFGFLTSPMFQVCHNFEEAQTFYKAVQAKRELLPFAIDGVVFKTNHIATREDIGYTSKMPKWAVAWKFEAEEATTILEDVVFQVGRTGQICPVAKCFPVEVSGSTISSVTLHNQGEIDKKGLCYGDTIVIIKAGDVIPKISHKINELSSADNKPIQIPSHCPSCESPIEQDGALHYCTGGSVCPDQILRTLQRYVGKKAMNMDGFGDKTMEEMVNLGLVKSLPDIYGLNHHTDDLIRLSGFGEKSVQKLLASIESAKTPTLQRFIYSLGINEVGETASTELTKHFQTIESLFEATYDDFISINDIGDKTANSLVDFFQSENGKELVANLLAAGVTPTQGETQSIGQTLVGKIFVVTGSFSVHARKDIEATIKSLGGKISGSPSAKTAAVFAGEAAGSKLAKAQSIEGLRIIEDQELNALIASAGGSIGDFVSTL